MRQQDLTGAVHGKPIRTIVRDKMTPCPLNHVNRQFHAPRLNMLWLFDFTYVSTWPGVVSFGPALGLRAGGGPHSSSPCVLSGLFPLLRYAIRIEPRRIGVRRGW